MLIIVISGRFPGKRSRLIATRPRKAGALGRKSDGVFRRGGLQRLILHGRKPSLAAKRSGIHDHFQGRRCSEQLVRSANSAIECSR
ncbi:MAG: hypothetical protein MZV64_71545 [Ignavibacteriales bacterium]|nr:hypothetical protein [Ignavibacteriales bacterium]